MAAFEDRLNCKGVNRCTQCYGGVCVCVCLYSVMFSVYSRIEILGNK